MATSNTIYTGKSLELRANVGKLATSHKRADGSTVVGKPLTLHGAVGTFRRYSGIAQSTFEAFVAESNPEARAKLLEGLDSTEYDGGRAVLAEPTVDAFRAAILAEVLPEGEEMTDELQAAAMARVESMLASGAIAFPATGAAREKSAVVSGVAWMFAKADATATATATATVKPTAK